MSNTNYIVDPADQPGAMGKGQQTATALNTFFQFWCYITPVSFIGNGAILNSILIVDAIFRLLVPSLPTNFWASTRPLSSLLSFT